MMTYKVFNIILLSLLKLSHSSSSSSYRPPYSSTTNDPTTASPGGECPEGWIESLEGCFLFHNSANSMTWREGQEECEILGGYLAEIGSEEEQTFLASIATLEEELIGTASWLIGLTDQGHEGRWMWQHSATDPEFTSWGIGQPDDQNSNNDCAIMDAEQDYKWVAVHCDTVEAKPLCKRDVNNGGASSTTDTPTTSGYSYVELRRGWDEASGNVYAMNRDGYLGPVCDDGLEDGSYDGTRTSTSRTSPGNQFESETSTSRRSSELNSRLTAEVVCKQLGYDGGVPFCCAAFGYDYGDEFAMNHVVCDGSESSIQECSYSAYIEDCDYYETYGVSCWYD